MTNFKVLRIGIASRDEMRDRTLAIASGKLKPSEDDPKVWFTSIKSLGEVLSNENRLLLEIIRRSKPSSLQEIADLSQRETSNLSRTLRTMERYQLVEIEKSDKGLLLVTVPYERVSCDVPLGTDASLAPLPRAA